MLRTHDRYAYSSIVGRPPYEWPNGARLAVYVAVNLELFPFGEGLGPELNPRQPEPDVVNHSWRDWGNRVGVWRLIELLDEHSIPAAALVNTALYDHCPEVVAAFRARGDEIVGHGRTNAERQSEMDEATERSMIDEVTERIAREEGRPPLGWLGPWVSQTWVTPDLLQEAGYRYLLDWGHDDQPVWLRTRSGGRILSIPYPRPTNDLPLMHGAKVVPSAWTDILIDQFDEMLEQSRRQPLVFNLSLHPYLIGQAFRLRQLRRLVEHIVRARERIWLTRPGAVAEHARALPEGVVP
ncbi:MAG TPA: polysaccharide deacetylase family protein [Burkholderiales bacterium]|nr:polysaccharide deacetylase family protein [Burkholderiales bacterium]